MFNADLALSVTMTGISTLLSVVMLPLNLLIYTSGTYSNDVVKALDWFSLFLSLVVVIGGITAGVVTSAWYNSTRFKASLCPSFVQLGAYYSPNIDSVDCLFVDL